MALVKRRRLSSTVALARVIPRIPCYLCLIIGLLRDGRIPKRHRALLLAVLGYNVSPVDLVPGVIPVVGQMDDLAVLLLGLRWVLTSCEQSLAEDHLESAGLTLEDINGDLNALGDTTLWLAGKSAALALAGARAFTIALRRGAKGASQIIFGDRTA